MKKILLTILLASTIWSVSYATEPLTVHASNKYLVGVNSGTPVYLSGCAAWSMFQMIRPDSATIFLTDRKNKRFNAVMCNVIEHYFSTNWTTWANIDGIVPFTGGTAFVNPNDAYFKRVDSMVARADTLGMYIIMDPVYLGNPFNQGWGDEIRGASAATLKAWGTYLGSRYKSYPNIIWMIGGDYGTTVAGSFDPYAALLPNLDSFVVGLQAADNVYPRLYTQHFTRFRVSTHVRNPSWLNLDQVYSGDNGDLTGIPSSHVRTADSAYTDAIKKPFISIEQVYENEAGSSQLQRRQMWQGLLSGCVGYVFGNCPIWDFSCAVTDHNCSVVTNPWSTALGSQGSLDMKRFDSLLVTKAWYNLVPDRAGATITTGNGTLYDSLNYHTFAYDSVGGTCIIGYIQNTTAMTVSMSKIGTSYSQIHSYWYSPSGGTVTEIATETKPASKSFTAPGAGDWVLVVEGTGAPVTTKPPLIIKGVKIKGAKVGS